MWTRCGVVSAIGLVACLCAWCAPARGQETAPFKLALDEPESVYAPPSAMNEEEGVNAGGVNVDLRVNYLTDYVWRGIERFDAVLPHEDRANLQFDGRLEFNLGKLPHPFVGLFTNVQDQDPVTNFEEIRPYFGLEWTIKPLTLTVGNTTYIFPDRDDLGTSEVFFRLGIDDSFLLRTDEPVLSPYVMVAYDYDRYNGWYVEAGVKHDFVLEDTGLTITPVAEIGYVSGLDLFRARLSKSDTGFQHWQVGLVGTYSINKLLNLGRRFGEFDLIGYLYYTDGISNEVRADTQLWGGAGIGFRY